MSKGQPKLQLFQATFHDQPAVSGSLLRLQFQFAIEPSQARGNQAPIPARTVGIPPTNQRGPAYTEGPNYLHGLHPLLPQRSLILAKASAYNILQYSAFVNLERSY